MTIFRAANLSQGIWTPPYFDCDGLVKRWLITYVSPFFGWNSLRNRIEFKYVTTAILSLFVIYLNIYTYLQGSCGRVHGYQEAGY